MSREERQSLLHEGVSATTTLSAFGQPLHLFCYDPNNETADSGDHF